MNKKEAGVIQTNDASEATKSASGEVVLTAPASRPSSDVATENLSRWVAILRNPKSGTGRRKRELLHLVHELKRLGLKPRLFRQRHLLNRWMSEPANTQRLRCLVAAGGDGTVDELISRYPGFPIAILPLGTENLLARYLGPVRHGRDLARVITEGHLLTLDVGAVGTRRFALMLSAGVDAAIIEQVHRQRQGTISRWHYVRPVFTHLFRRDWPPLRISVDGQPPLTGHHVWIFNLAQYPLRLRISPDASGTDGRFTIHLLQANGPWDLSRKILNVYRGRGGTGTGWTVLEGTRCTIEAESVIPVQIDGDPLDQTPIDAKIIPRGLQLLVPASTRDKDAQLPAVTGPSGFLRTGM